MMAKVKTSAMIASHSEIHRKLGRTCTSQTSPITMWGSTGVSRLLKEELKIMRSTWLSQVGLLSFQGQMIWVDSPKSHAHKYE